jgi:hypothetical protein
MAMSREFYIKPGAMKVAPKDLPVVFYIYQAGKDFAAQCFIGRAQKPTWHYRFLSAKDREAYIKKQIAAVQSSENRKAEKRAAEKKPHGYEVGMILVSSWGYDQTNIDFYEVVEVIGKSMVKLEKIGKQRANDSSNYSHGMAQEVVPCVDSRSGDFYRSKVTQYGAAGRFGYKASPWNGKPLYESWYA